MEEEIPSGNSLTIYLVCESGIITKFVKPATLVVLLHL